MVAHSSSESDSRDASSHDASALDSRAARVGRASFSWRAWTLILAACAVGFLGMVAAAYVTAFDTPAARSDGGSTTRVQRRVQRPSPADEFDLSGLTIPRESLLHGGPPKDGIPAISDPEALAGKHATYLKPGDRVIGVEHGGEARAYPLRVLNYHEIVNDRVGEQPVAVTYCPLCDSAAVFDRRTPLGVREFGVSGMLYNSNVLMYDRSPNADSLWSQMMTQGVSGAAAGRELTPLPVELTTWDEWLSRHPDTTVISLQTGHQRDYQRSPYDGYLERPGLVFPAEPKDERLPTKEPVLGVWTENAARAFPRSAFSRDRTVVRDEIDGRKVVVAFNPETGTLRVDSAEEGLHWVYALWFAWYAFHPETTVYSSGS